MKDKSKKIKVAVVTSTYARFCADPQVPWMRELVSRTQDEDFDIRIFAPSFKGLKTHKIDNVPVHRFRYAPSCWEALTHDEGAPNKMKSIWNKLLVIPYILMGTIAVFFWCLFKRINVLHIHWPFPHAIWGILPKYLLGVKVVVMSHGAELAIARRSGMIRIVLGWLLRRADVRCANSSHTANEILKVSGMNDTLIIPYGTTVASKGSGTGKSAVPMLLFSGRLIQRKGIDVLLRAMPHILAEKEVQLVITGEGDKKEEWKALAAELQIHNNIRFAGFVSSDELAELYGMCSVYVHPAIFDDNGDTEGLGVVLIEALSHRKPVVASAVGGIVDVIKHGKTGVLVNEKDSNQLAAAVLEVLRDKEMAALLGLRGYHHVKEYFDWDRISEQILDIYRDVSVGRPVLVTH